MTKTKASLDSIAQQAANTLIKKLAVALLAEAEPLAQLDVLNTHGADVLLWYDVEDDELEQLYEEHILEIEALQKLHIPDNEKMLSYATDPVISTVWWAINQTLYDIKAIIDKEL